MLALLKLMPEEEATVPLLHEFAAEHPGVTIVTPHYQHEMWQADIATGAAPGEGEWKSHAIGADWPSGLLRMLQRLFADGHPEDVLEEDSG